MREAATLILMRSPGDPHVYWVRRGDCAPFLAGFHVFPGGLVEARDSKRHGSDTVASARTAAIRETQEEIGACVSGDDGLTKYLGAWIAPPYLVYPLKTHFFYRWVNADVIPRDAESDEVSDGEWIRPADAVERWNRGQVLIAPPTMAILRALAEDGPEFPSAAFTSREALGFEPTFSPVRPDMMMIPLRTPTLPPATHTNCYVLGGQELLVVEPASRDPAALEAVFDYLDGRLAEGARIKAFVLTHHHHDHIGGIELCVARYGGPVWAHKLTATRVPFEIHRHLDDGDQILLSCGQSWRVLFTPGHAPGHICLVEEETRSMIVGDMVAGVGSILVEPTDGDMSAYLRSLEMMQGERPTCLLPSHGPYVGCAERKLQAYVDHRLEREASLLRALAGTDQLIGLVEAVYVDVPSALRAGPSGGLAGLSLRAHLDKLVDDGRVIHGDDGRWRLVESVS